MSFGEEFALPVGQTGYIGGTMQRIKVPGDGLWAVFMGYAPVLYKKTPGANRMMVLHRYRAEINGEVYDKPAFSLYRTNNGGVPCVSLELQPAGKCGKYHQKGQCRVRYGGMDKPSGEKIGLLRKQQRACVNSAGVFQHMACGLCLCKGELI